MNQLENVTLENPILNNGTMYGSFISPSNLELSNCCIVNIDASTMISVDGEYFSGADLKEIFTLKSKLKDIYPEMFI